MNEDFLKRVDELTTLVAAIEAEDQSNADYFIKIKALYKWINLDFNNKQAYHDSLIPSNIQNKIKDYEEIELSRSADVKSFEIALTNLLKEKKKMRWIVAVSATFFILIGSGFLLNHSKKSLKPATEVAQTLIQNTNPGNNKATITLADGRIIELDSSKTGLLATQGTSQINNNGSVLSYLNTSSVTTIDKPIQSAFNIITTPKGGQYQLLLPDGTKAYLNSASSLKFPVSFTGNSRTVELTGEAYFEVVQNNKMPFHVLASKIDVQVLGTSFNVMAYSNENTVLTTLIEGGVKISQTSPAPSSKLSKPGQQAVVYTGSSSAPGIKLNEVDVEDVIAWKSGDFSFNHTDIKTIFRQLSRWYDIEIDYQGNVPDKTFTGMISRKRTLSEVLDILKLKGLTSSSADGKNIIIK